MFLGLITLRVKLALTFQNLATKHLEKLLDKVDQKAKYLTDLTKLARS
jgi:hypothetical protein